MSVSASNPASVADISFHAGKMILTFADGRELSVPLAMFPRLANATDAQLNNWRVIGPGIGINWPDLDEDLSIKKLLDPRPVGRAKPSDSK